MATVIPGKQLHVRGTKEQLSNMLLAGELGWCTDDNSLYYRDGDTLRPVCDVVSLPYGSSIQDVQTAVSTGTQIFITRESNGEKTTYAYTGFKSGTYYFSSIDSTNGGISRISLSRDGNDGIWAFSSNNAYAAASSIASIYSSDSTYTIGDLVENGGVLYICTTPIETPETWNPAHWKQSNLASQLESKIKIVKYGEDWAEFLPKMKTYIEAGDVVLLSGIYTKSDTSFGTLIEYSLEPGQEFFRFSLVASIPIDNSIIQLRAYRIYVNDEGWSASRTSILDATTPYSDNARDYVLTPYRPGSVALNINVQGIDTKRYLLLDETAASSLNSKTLYAQAICWGSDENGNGTIGYFQINTFYPFATSEFLAGAIENYFHEDAGGNIIESVKLNKNDGTSYNDIRRPFDPTDIIAHTFYPNTHYHFGDLRMYKNQLYRCRETHDAVDFDSSKWDLVILSLQSPFRCGFGSLARPGGIVMDAIVMDSNGGETQQVVVLHSDVMNKAAPFDYSAIPCFTSSENGGYLQLVPTGNGYVALYDKNEEMVMLPSSTMPDSIPDMTESTPVFTPDGWQKAAPSIQLGTIEVYN